MLTPKPPVTRLPLQQHAQNGNIWNAVENWYEKCTYSFVFLKLLDIIQWNHGQLHVSCLAPISYQGRHNECKDVSITGVSIFCSTFCPGAHQRKYQSSAWLAFVRGSHRWHVNSPQKGQVTRKSFPYHDVIIISVYTGADQFLVLPSLVHSRYMPNLRATLSH